MEGCDCGVISNEFMGTSEVVGVVEIEGGRVVDWCSP